MYNENKFKEFNRSLTIDAEVIVVAYPEVLGDDYEELCENLARLAESGKRIAIAGRMPPKTQNLTAIRHPADV